MSSRTKRKLIRKQEAQEEEFSVTSFRKQCHPRSPLIMHSTALPRRNYRAICMTHWETILHRPDHIKLGVLQIYQGKAFLLATCIVISWIFKGWRSCDGANESGDFAPCQLKYKYVKIWGKVMKMSMFNACSPNNCWNICTVAPRGKGGRNVFASILKSFFICTWYLVLSHLLRTWTILFNTDLWNELWFS